MMKISVLGSGGWGTAVAKVLNDNGHDVTLWSKFEKEAEMLRSARENPLLKGVAIPEGIKITASADDAAVGIDIAVFATPSFAVSETAVLFRDKLPKDCIIVCISKGIEKDTMRLFSQILRETFGEDAR
ncbi:MAG: NAD(P)-binding domain-containing protein, partial [Clostridiales bacterium]|nr:NAD(P)-binding domain-containing protein [Clostridiales bacterium]